LTGLSLANESGPVDLTRLVEACRDDMSQIFAAWFSILEKKLLSL
jgi:hypothetical protein